jgi:Ca2+-binding RTX toxin-like protein
VITSDALNKNGSFTVTGTSEANSTIDIYDGSTLLGSRVPSGTGQWNFTTGILSSKTVHSFTSTATDAAGNVGQSSGTVIYGTGGHDNIGNSSGNDLLTGGAGADNFVFSNVSFGKDVVTDFNSTGSKHDVLEFAHNVFASAADVLAHAAQIGKDVVITHDANDTITLVGVHLNQLPANDFIIV